MPKVIELTDITFDDEIKKHEDEPMLVMFHAPWCGHCKTQDPIIEKLAREMNNVAIAKMNIEENQRKALEYSITGVPAFLVFKDGKIVDHKAGAHQLADLRALVQKYTY